jgi:hypothetical protein
LSQFQLVEATFIRSPKAFKKQIVDTSDQQDGHLRGRVLVHAPDIVMLLAFRKIMEDHPKMISSSWDLALVPASYRFRAAKEL